MRYKIDNHIPIPEGLFDLPMEDMEVGQSFFFHPTNKKQNKNTLRSAVSRRSKQINRKIASAGGKPKKFTTRNWSEKIKGEIVHGIRVWRVK